MGSSIQKHSCVICARRKVKCDKLSPCSNCSKSQSECLYQDPALSHRHRKRPADEDLLAKISEYEDLMRKNNVKFQPLDNSWIASPLEKKLVSRPQAARPGSCTQTGASRCSSEAQDSAQQSQIETPDTPSEAARLWSGLPKELRETSIEKLKRSVKDLAGEVTETETETDSSFGTVTSLLIPVRLSGAPRPLEIHPEPKHIFKLWQTFTENVNPLTKVIHVPTLAQRILEVSWNLETVTRPLEAVMFGVYALAITSMKPSDCVEAFGETRQVLLNRYRSGAAEALIAAELHSTKDLEVLQALVLFLLLDSRSELSVTVIAIATRIGHKMGLHRTDADPHLPFFEQEMRLRAWWQIMGLESRTRRKSLGLKSSWADYGDVRMPLNLNDADLHPQMTHRPAAATGATEMLYCLLKYEIANYVRGSQAASAAKDADELLASASPTAMTRKRTMLAEVEAIYEEKYLRHCDASIPFHRIALTVARLTVHRARFWYCYPRHRPDGGRGMSPADEDVVFESSVRLLQLDVEGRETHFSAHLLEYQLVCTEVEALVYMFSELRRRVSGELVDLAWAMAARMYEEYPQLLQRDDKVYTALADLTLKAWEARWREIEGQGGVLPEFIAVLQRTRGNAGIEDEVTAGIAGMMPDGDFQFGSMHDDPLDWVLWNELPQL